MDDMEEYLMHCDQLDHVKEVLRFEILSTIFKTFGLTYEDYY